MKFLTSLAAVCVLYTAGAQAPNVNISNYIFFDTEPFIAVNPSNANHIIAGWMKLTGASQVSIATSYSNDGGLTWSTPQNMPHLYPQYTSADVSIDFNSSGKAFLSYVDFMPSKDSGSVFVASSVNGGVSWSTPVEVTNGLETTDKPVDRPWIQVDRSGGTYDGNIYVASINVEGGTTNHVYLKSSTDDGLTWSPLMMLDDSIPADLIRTGGALTVGGDGAVYLGYFSWHLSMALAPRAIIRKSTNGGNSFSHIVMGNITTSSGINDTLQGSAVLSANPANANNLVFTFTDGRNGDADILSMHSNDAGQTWNFSAPVRVNDDVLSNGVEQDMCWAGFAPNGTYCTAWRDRRSSGNLAVSPFEIWVAASFDGGATFKPNKLISTAISNDIAIQSGNDFIGVACSNNYVHLDWCDARTSNWEIYTSRELLSGLTEIDAEIVTQLQINCYPNPFSNEISFAFDLKQSVRNARVEVFETSGKSVAVLFEGALPRGNQELKFNGAALPRGHYIFRLSSGNIYAEKSFVKE